MIIGYTYTGDDVNGGFWIQDLDPKDKETVLDTMPQGTCTLAYLRNQLQAVSNELSARPYPNIAFIESLISNFKESPGTTKIDIRIRDVLPEKSDYENNGLFIGYSPDSTQTIYNNL